MVQASSGQANTACELSESPLSLSSASSWMLLSPWLGCSGNLATCLRLECKGWNEAEIVDPVSSITLIFGIPGVENLLYDITLLGQCHRTTILADPVLAVNSKLEGHHFLWNGGGHEFPKVHRQCFCDPLFDDQKFYDPPPELQCWRNMKPPMCVKRKICIFGAISLNKIFIKIVATQ